MVQLASKRNDSFDFKRSRQINQPLEHANFCPAIFRTPPAVRLTKYESEELCLSSLSQIFTYGKFLRRLHHEERVHISVHRRQA